MPPMEMSRESIDEYTEKMRERYAGMSGSQACSRLLDEYVEVTGFERKYGNKVLPGKRRQPGQRSQLGRGKTCGASARRALKNTWLEMEQPRGKRMKDMIPLRIDHRKLQTTTRAQLPGMRAESIDRILSVAKTNARRCIRPHWGNNAVKESVGIGAESWAVTEPRSTRLHAVVAI